MAADDDVEASEALVAAIHAGDVVTLQRLIRERPELVSGPFGGRFGARTPLQAVTDWPGYCPNGPASVRILLAAGADPDGRSPGGETPLHWSSSDAEPLPDREALSQGFWHACVGGQRRAAEYLLGRGADLNWVPDYAHGTALDAADCLGTQQQNVITWLRELGARSGEVD